ncbi:hypothetical protein Tco_1228267, partial [Tanacetum coccineum]
TQPQKAQKPRKPKIKDTQVPQPSDPSENVADEDVHKELGDSLVRAATTASSLEAEQDSDGLKRSSQVQARIRRIFLDGYGILINNPRVLVILKDIFQSFPCFGECGVRFQNGGAISFGGGVEDEAYGSGGRM